MNALRAFEYDGTSRALLALHETNESEALFSSLVKLFDARFSRHSIVAGFRFHSGMPTVVLREGIVQTNDGAIDYSMEHPGLLWLRSNPGARIVRVSDIMALPELKQTKYFQAVITVEGWTHSIGLFFWIGYELIAMVGINRTEAQGDFSEDDVAWCESVYENIEVAMKRVAAAEAERMVRFSLADSLLNVSDAHVIVDWDLEPAHLNDAARVTIRKHWPTLEFTEEDVICPKDLLSACTTMKERVIQSLQLNAPLPSPEPISIALAGSELVAIRVELLRLSAEPLAWPVFSIRFVASNEPARVLSPVAFSSLTATELHLAMLVAYGHSNKELARLLGKSALTVRNQLSSVFEKLGIRNRVELVAALASESSSDRSRKQ
jgi:DNA-binding CsgD family transcriptional regulator